MRNETSRVYLIRPLLLGLTLALFLWAPSALFAQPVSPRGAQSQSGPMINEIMAANVSAAIDPDFGTFSDWIEIFNPGEEDLDLSNFSLTDNIRNPQRWSIPPGTIVPAGEYILLWADGRDSGLHTNFRLSRDGEEVALYSQDGRLVDMVRFGDQAEDVSYARVTDGAAEWAFFQQATPGQPNRGAPLETVSQVAAPAYVPAGGRFEGPIEVALSVSDPAAEIRYTLDGSAPVANSALYQAPIQLEETTIIRARAFKSNLLASPVSTQTYVVGEHSRLPIISLAIEPEYLWDDEIGIYVDEEIDKRKDWERPASIALYEPDGSVGFQAEANIRLFGTTAIYLPQKSLAIFIRDGGQGSERIAYQLFPDRELSQYGSFLLRSGSDDWAGTMLRDAFGQQVIEGYMDLGSQAFRPALLFINGDYFGIHNIREKENEDYLLTHYGVDLDQLDFLFVGYHHDDSPHDLTVLYGDASDYEALAGFIQDNDLSAPENYGRVQLLLNTDHFIDYIIAESYVGNTSWHRNRKVWRAQPPFQRWDFLVYDLDRGFGRLYTNTLQDILRYDPLFRALVNNETFRNQFIQRFAQHLNVTFEPERLLPILDSQQILIAPEIERQRAFWPVAAWWADNYKTEAQVTGRSERPELPAWQEEVVHLQEFIRERPDALRQHVVEAFSLSGTQFLTLDVNDKEGGHILVEGQPLPGMPFTGVYFRDIPLQITAVAEPGYRFVEWQGAATNREETITHQLTSNETLTAVFEPVLPANPWLDPAQTRSAAMGLILLLTFGGMFPLIHWLNRH
ncbi:MAG: CotH kinase family protein [Candidatus Promineifilaceae bacterium]